jgi:hypothetical protein
MKPVCVVVVLLSCIKVSYTCPSACSCSVNTVFEALFCWPQFSTLFILDNLNISNIKSSDPSFSTQENTYNLYAVAGIPGGIEKRYTQ